MLASMTASDFQLWRAFYATIPDRTEFYLSQICHLITAGAGIKRKDGQAFTSPADFMPDLRTDEEKIDAARHYAEMKAAFREMQEDARHALNGQARLEAD